MSPIDEESQDEKDERRIQETSDKIERINESLTDPTLTPAKKKRLRQSLLTAKRRLSSIQKGIRGRRRDEKEIEKVFRKQDASDRSIRAMSLTMFFGWGGSLGLYYKKPTKRQLLDLIDYLDQEEPGWDKEYSKERSALARAIEEKYPELIKFSAYRYGYAPGGRDLSGGHGCLKTIIVGVGLVVLLMLFVRRC